MAELSSGESDLFHRNRQPVRELLVGARAAREVMRIDHYQPRPLCGKLAVERPFEPTLVYLALAEAHDGDEIQSRAVQVVDGEIAAGAAGDRDDAAAILDERQVSGHVRVCGPGPGPE